jgi:hypothetical protein
MKRRIRLLVAILALAALAVALVWALLHRQSHVPLVAPIPTPTPTVALTPTPTPTPTPTQSTVSVASYGAKGDGASDDTAAVTAALKANAGKKVAVYFPAGTYKITSIVLPDNVTLVGAGADTTWIDGRLQAGSASQVSDLTLGGIGMAFRFVNGASHTTFTRVSFVGGGSMTSGEDQGVIRFSGDRAASFITFTDCDIAANAGGGDGVAMVDTGWSGGTYHDIIFQGSHFGGSPVMDFECIQRADGVHAITTGYYNINLSDCVFEPSGAEAISFDSPTGAAGHSTISGNTIKGAGWNSAYPWHQGVEFNGAVGMTFTHNTVYRCAGDMINHQGYGTASDNVFSDNTFDGTVSYIGQTPTLSTDTIYFVNVSGATFTNNVVKTDVGGPLVGLSGSACNSFQGNSFIDTRAQAAAHQALWVTGTSTKNVFDDCLLQSPVQYGTAVFVSGATANTVENSTFVSSGSAPVRVGAGLALVQVKNTYR